MGGQHRGLGGLGRVSGNGDLDHVGVEGGASAHLRPQKLAVVCSGQGFSLSRL